MKDYLEEIPEHVWEYVESWFNFNNQKQTVMKTREEIFNELMKRKKEEIADICAGVIDAIRHNMNDISNSPYHAGWTESRKTIYEIWIKPYINI